MKNADFTYTLFSCRFLKERETQSKIQTSSEYAREAAQISCVLQGGHALLEFSSVDTFEACLRIYAQDSKAFQVSIEILEDIYKLIQDWCLRQCRSSAADRVSTGLDMNLAFNGQMQTITAALTPQETHEILRIDRSLGFLRQYENSKRSELIRALQTTEHRLHEIFETLEKFVEFGEQPVCLMQRASKSTQKL
jgi:hypothetical protein